MVKQAIKDAEFHPGVHGEPPPDVRGKDVIIVDFSYSRPTIERMRDEANSLLILDHHKTAYESLHDLDGIDMVLDMDRSGARITWDYFNPGIEPPQALLHVEDRDLWRFDLPNTREIQAVMFSHEYSFENWDHLMSIPPDHLIQEGTAIERKHFKDLNELLPITTRRMIIGGHNVPVANLPYTLASDAASMLAASNEPFGACYMDTPTGRLFSLRSTPSGVDVSAVAKMYGGGGHKHSSGFRVPYDIARQFEHDWINLHSSPAV